MNNGLPDVAFAVFVIGAIIVSATLARPVLERFGLPDVVGYVVIGMALSAIDHKIGMVSHEIQAGLHVLAAAGVIILLFRVGLESNPAKLIDQLPNAGVTLIGSIVPSGLLGYLAARYLIGTDPLPALFAGVALTATSVGVSFRCGANSAPSTRTTARCCSTWRNSMTSPLSSCWPLCSRSRRCSLGR